MYGVAVELLFLFFSEVYKDDNTEIELDTGYVLQKLCKHCKTIEEFGLACSLIGGLAGMKAERMGWNLDEDGKV